MTVPKGAPPRGPDLQPVPGLRAVKRCLKAVEERAVKEDSAEDQRALLTFYGVTHQRNDATKVA